MADLWFPGGVYDPGPPAVWGTQAGTGGAKFLLHTTDGPLGVYTPDPHVGDGRRYYGNTGTWPNYTLAWHAPSGGWRVYQHIPADRSSLSLVHAPGQGETNRDNVTQVEIATYPAGVGGLPDAALDQLARLLAWERQVRGVPLVSAVSWPPYPQSYGQHAGQRLSWPTWHAYAGVLGHMHAPQNDHGDPGAVNIGGLLSRARAYTTQPAPEDPVTDQDKQDIVDRVLAGLLAQVFSVQPTIRQAGPGQVIGATYNKVGDLQTVTGQLTATLAAVAGQVTAVLGELAPQHPALTEPPPIPPPSPADLAWQLAGMAAQLADALSAPTAPQEESA